MIVPRFLQVFLQCQYVQDDFQIGVEGVFCEELLDFLNFIYITIPTNIAAGTPITEICIT